MARAARPFPETLLRSLRRLSPSGRVRALAGPAALLVVVAAPMLSAMSEPSDEPAPLGAPIVHARAERDLVYLPPDAPTFWVGTVEGRGERAAAPLWVLEPAQPDAPLSIDAALAAPPRVIEVAAPRRRTPAGAAALDMDPAAREFIAPPIETGAVAAAPSAPSSEPAAEAPAPPPESENVDHVEPSVAPSVDPAVAAAITRAPSVLLAASDGPPARAPAPRPRPRPLVASVETATSGREPRVVIILTAVGVNPEASRRALDRLPPEIAVAVAPIAADAADWVAAARESGRVVLAEIPMEPESRRVRDPGPLTLRVAADAATNLERLDRTLALLPGVDGVATYLGGRFTADADALRPVLAELKARSLFIVETAPGPLSRVREIGGELGLRTAASVVSLDKSGRARDISDGLALLEEEARRSGRAVGVAVAVPSTIRALEEWSGTARARGVRLTPLRL